MLKNEFLIFLRDADICKEIFEIIRHGGKPFPLTVPATASQFPAKVEFLKLLHEADICKEIFEIVRRGGKPGDAQKIVSNAAQSSMSLREQIRNRITNRMAGNTAQTSAPTQGNVALKNEISYESTDQDEAEESPNLKTLLSSKLELLKSKAEGSGVDGGGGAVELPFDMIAAVLKKPCPICGQKTRVTMIKPQVGIEDTDYDFCVHRQGVNQYLYSVWVCESCGYAADMSRFLEKPSERVRRPLKAFLEENDFRTPFTEQRDKEEALMLYDMAIQFSKMFEQSKLIEALLYQKMAWICRIEDDEPQELLYIQKIVELLEQSLKDENYPVGKLTEDFAAYMLGVNYYYLDDTNKATKLFQKIVSSRTAKKDSPEMYEKAREMAAVVRMPKARD
ncbi:MAG: DUF2225 domain-containing protein [Selenomonadaceae bacterium]|nr:DUF2225 domain-containing protein [Selenomonadaceae bacterium]